MEFERCLYDPFRKDLVSKMESDYEEFRLNFGNLQSRKEEVLRYIIIMYDLKSPYRQMYPDHMDRKREAALRAGFALGVHKTFSNWVEDMLVGQNEEVNVAIVKYLMLFGIPELTALEGCISQFVAESEKMMKRKGDMKTYQLQKALMHDMDRYENKIFGGQEALDMRKALYQNLEQRRRAVRPEDIAKRLKDNPSDKLDDFSPYGEDYQVEPLKFIGDEPPL